MSFSKRLQSFNSIPSRLINTRHSFYRSNKRPVQAQAAFTQNPASKGDCNACGKALRIKNNGRLWKHTISPGEVCPGSGANPVAITTTCPCGGRASYNTVQKILQPHYLGGVPCSLVGGAVRSAYDKSITGIIKDGIVHR